MDLIALDLKGVMLYSDELAIQFPGSDGLFSQANHTPVTRRGSFQ